MVVTLKKDKDGEREVFGVSKNMIEGGIMYVDYKETPVDHRPIVVKQECTIHGETEHLQVFTEGGWNGTSSCLECVKEIIKVLKTEKRDKKETK